VFIGGAVAPLLQSHPPFPRARVTSDVDGVIGSTTYAELERLQDQLTARGFRQGPDGAHMHRWIAPDGIPFDLIPSGDHPGGSGNPWDAVALETALELELEDGLVIRHVGAPAFLAQKWSAHHDRGRNDPLTSHDLEDILALLASRPGIAEEVAAAPIELSAYLGQQARAFLNDPDAEDLLAAHLNNAQDPAFTIEAVRVVLRRLAAFF
jgi:predicted nucleotidyltransferase